jgi:predicted dehydrogenase
MRPVRVGVWGVGVWGEKHARVYQAIPEADFAGVFDRDAARAAAVAARYGGRVFETPDALLEACEAVSIAVPTVAHREAAERAAAAGRHVLVEKPMAPALADADAMIAAAQRSGVTLQVGQVERFNPAYLAARAQVDRPKFVEAHRLAVFQPRSLDVDVVFDLMIHDIDLVLDCVKAPLDHVSAVGVAVLSRNEDIANARLEFRDGCVANLTASRVSQDRLRRIRFFQADSYLSVDLFARGGDHLRMRRGPAPAGAGGLAALSGMFERHALEVAEGEPLLLELAAFLRSLRGDGAGAASAAAGREALHVAEQVRDAMKQRSQLWAAKPTAAS